MNIRKEMSLDFNINRMKQNKTLQMLHGKTSHLSTSSKIILSIIIVIVLWMATGLFKHSVKDEDKVQSTFTKVKTLHSIAMERKISLNFNGYTKPYQNVKIMPEVDGKVIEMFAKNGQFLRKGEPIIQVEFDTKQAEFKKTKANLEKQRFTYESVKKVYEKKLSSEGALKLALSDLKSAESSFDQSKVSLERTIIRAPFDGYIDELMVHKGDFINLLMPTEIAKFSSINPILVIAYIPQTDIDIIKNSKIVNVTNNRGEIVEGQVIFVSKIANPATRTFQVEALIKNDNEKFQIGESVKIDFFLDGQKKLHKIPKSSIVLDVAGNISVKIIDDSSKVKTMPIKIMDEDDDSLWVEGLDDEVNLITLGANYVKNDEQVEALS